MVMFSLVICVGMLVDGAIVIVEYADRKIHEGMEQTEAYIRAAKLMFWPIFSSTATTLAAFVPLLFWPGVAGEFMSYLPIMVIIVLTGFTGHSNGFPSSNGRCILPLVYLVR